MNLLDFLSSIVFISIGSFIGYLVRGYFLKQSSKVQITNKLIDSLYEQCIEMRERALILINKEEHDKREVIHHVFVAQNTRLRQICTEIHHNNKPIFPIPNDKLKLLKQSCDLIIEQPDLARVYGGLIHAQSSLIDTYRYQKL